MLNPFSWTLDSWFTFLQVASAVILSLTVAVGYLLNKRQNRELQQVKLGVAKQQERAANAEKETLELRERMLRKETPRWVLLSKLGDLIKGKPTGAFEVVFVPDDDEAHQAAITVEAFLSTAGWRILKNLRPASEDLVLPQFATPAMRANPFHLPLLSRMGSNGEFTVVGSPEDSGELGISRPDTAANAVMLALMNCGFRVGSNNDSRLPAGTVRIIVGPRQ